MRSRVIASEAEIRAHLEQNGARIVAQTQKFRVELCRQNRLRLRSGNGPGQLQIHPLDSRTRIGSEMPLCLVSSRHGILPRGFVGVHGQVTQKHGSDSYTSLPHLYGRGQGGVIYDLFPGQFVATVGARTKPGERLAKLREKAPDLFIPVGGSRSGVVALVGERRDINRRLGLDYGFTARARRLSKIMHYSRSRRFRSSGINQKADTIISE